MDFLDSKDIVVLQDAMGLYLGDTFWRARVPGLFHEVQDVGTQKLDWQYLSLGLERLLVHEGRDSPMWARRHVLGQLDDLAGIIAGVWICKCLILSHQSGN
ncbi:hypothetical protein BJX70DRAFT_384018 [Aspergillus crustosus]